MAVFMKLSKRRRRGRTPKGIALNGSAGEAQAEDPADAADDFLCVAAQADVLADAAVAAVLAWHGGMAGVSSEARRRELGDQLGELRRQLLRLQRLRSQAEGAAGSQARHDAIRALAVRVDEAEQLLDAALPPLRRGSSGVLGFRVTPRFGRLSSFDGGLAFAAGGGGGGGGGGLATPWGGCGFGGACSPSFGTLSPPSRAVVPQFGVV